MSGEKPRPAAAIRASRAAVRNDIGPPVQRYMVPLDYPELFRWVAGSSDTDDDWTTIAASGGSAGRWKRCARPDKGDDLTDADLTITVAGGPWRVVPVATLTDDRTNTLSVEGAQEGDTLMFTRLDVGAFEIVWMNDGTAGGEVATMPASERSILIVYFDGSDWVHRASGRML